MIEKLLSLGMTTTNDRDRVRPVRGARDPLQFEESAKNVFSFVLLLLSPFLPSLPPFALLSFRYLPPVEI